MFSSVTSSATGRTVLGIALGAVLFVAGNSLVDRLVPNGRLDLTQQQLYSLSPGTRAILARIDEPITLKFYYSQRLGEAVPQFGVYAQRVRELLQEYAALAHGKIKLQVLDPVAYSETEDQATAAGLQGVPVDETNEQVYFGLAGTNSTDDDQNIPFFQMDREKFLEYDLTKLVQSLAFPKKKVIGLVTGLSLEGDPMAQMQGRPSQPQVVMDQLRQGFEIHDLTTSFETVPEDVDVLMVVQPIGLSDKTQYAIDQWVLKGGHALVFVDPNSEFQQNHPSVLMPPGTPPVAQFDRMLKAWGVELVKDKVVGDRLAARRVNAGGGGGRVAAADYLAWLNLKGDALNKEDPITGQLAQLNFATAGALKPVEGAKTSFEPLVQSSAQSELIDTAKVQGLPDVVGLLRDFKADGTRYVLAARVVGPVSTAFPDGPPKDDSDKKAAPAKAPPPAQIKESKEPINVVVVADSDLLDDRFWVSVQDFFGQKVASPTAGNADFVQNAVDSLAGTGDLIGLRSRGTAVRPFAVVDTMQRDAEDRYRTEEKSLQDKLRETEGKLNELRAKQSDGKEQITPEQQQTIDQFRTTIIQTRTQLRQVQLALRQDIDRLKQRLVLADIGAVPVALVLVAVVLGVLRLRRRQRHSRTA